MDKTTVVNTPEDSWEDFNLELFYLHKKKKKKKVTIGLSSITMLQVVRHVHSSFSITDIRFVAENVQTKNILTEADINTMALNLNFLVNYLIDKKYYNFIKFELEFDHVVNIFSFNDEAVFFTFDENYHYEDILDPILKFNGYKPEIVYKLLYDNPGTYIEITKPGRIRGKYKSYPDFLNRVKS